MLTNFNQLKGLSVDGIDGELGTVSDCYFDDETWTIRYLIVDTGGWLDSRPALISPMSIMFVDWQALQVRVSLTKGQIKASPNIDAHHPVARTHEAAYLGYYGHPNYWDGPYLWGPSDSPLDSIDTNGSGLGNRTTEKDEGKSHLRSTDGVSGYPIEATDGEIGFVDGFVLDDKTWSIRYIEVATRTWWPGKMLLLSPAWIEQVSWENSKVYAGLSRKAIQDAPEYIDSMPINREYEERLYLHYGRLPYWLSQDEYESTIFPSTVS